MAAAVTVLGTEPALGDAVRGGLHATAAVVVELVTVEVWERERGEGREEGREGGAGEPVC